MPAVFDAGCDLPTRCFLDVVAALAQSEAVVRSGGSTATAWLSVITLSDGGVAIWGAASLISQPDELGESAREPP
ncbi:hypothetical protein LRC484719_02110 [Mycobacterium riyadhense]|nr:hypothetical protein [Mycobacterium riyadhense]